MKLAAILPLILATAAAPPATTPWSDDMPPERFRANGTSKVMFESPAIVRVLCRTGAEPKDMVVVGCAMRMRDGSVLIIAPNPCGWPGEWFARILCHERGHEAGWPGDHGP